MTPETVQEQAPQQEAVVEPVTDPKPEATPTETPAPNILERVAKAPDKPDTVPPTEAPIFNYNDIENIKDPDARKYAESAYKSMLGDYTRKTQELATERAKLETDRQDISNWSPEKVQALLKDESFVKAAQSATTAQQDNYGLTDDQYSALTEPEKKMLQDSRKQSEENRLAVQSIMEQNNKLLLQQQDEQLKGKYANYDAQSVDTITQDMLSGKYQATREDIWKVVNYEKAVTKAYELGKQDKAPEVQGKVQASSLDGLNVASSENMPVREEKESDRSWFQRLAMFRQAESHAGKQNTK